VALLTNGAFPDRAAAVSEELLAIHPRLHLTVNVSIDAWGEAHDRIRQVPGLFASLCQTLDALRDLAAAHPGRVGRSVAMVYSEETASTVGTTLDRVMAEIAPDAVSVTLERGDEPRPTTPVTDLDGYIAVAQRAAKYSVAAHLGRSRLPIVGPALLARAGALLGAAKPRAIVRAVRRDVPFGPCEAGRFIGVLRPNGAVTACELLPGDLGNVRDVDYDFRAVWNSMQADDVRRRIRETRCRCTHECYVNPTLLKHPISLAAALLGSTRT
jgi:MoaA/NifB/PqqE/SkfB family radical SAM enzyme